MNGRHARGRRTEASMSTYRRRGEVLCPGDHAALADGQPCAECRAVK